MSNLTVEKTHPLINSHSPHYQTLDGRESIVMMEALFTKEELMAWAKLNSFKYRFRIGNKDDAEKEISKIKSYESYYRYLEEIN